MFTGIIQQVAVVREIVQKSHFSEGGNADVEMTIQVPPDFIADVQLGDSIASDGCCLTVTGLLRDAYRVDVSQESLRVTSLHHWKPGRKINLEKALRAGDALGGHYVSGHVDGVGRVRSIHREGRSQRMGFEVSRLLGRYIARKGSVAVDGVSLTVNDVLDVNEGTWFEVNLVPHTLSHTTLDERTEGSEVNIEIDMLARYIERMQAADAATVLGT